MRRVYIETYGCQMNVADSELIVGVLVREGFVRTDDPAAADVMLVNTCAVRDHAEQRVLSRLGELKGFKRPGRVLGVVGCMAQRLGPRLLIVSRSTPRKRNDRPPPRQDESMWGMWGGGPGHGGGRSPACVTIFH